MPCIEVKPTYRNISKQMFLLHRTRTQTPGVQRGQKVAACTCWGWELCDPGVLTSALQDAQKGAQTPGSSVLTTAVPSAPARCGGRVPQHQPGTPGTKTDGLQEPRGHGR